MDVEIARFKKNSTFRGDSFIKQWLCRSSECTKPIGGKIVNGKRLSFPNERNIYITVKKNTLNYYTFNSDKHLNSEMNLKSEKIYLHSSKVYLNLRKSKIKF